MLTIHASVNGSIVDPEPKTDLHPKEIMLSVWCDIQGITYFELLPSNTTVDSKLYYNQLQILKIALQANRLERHKVHLLHDNTRAHTAKVTHQKLEKLGWQVLPYSPDLALTDNHPFCSLRNHLSEKDFDDQDLLKLDFETFFNLILRNSMKMIL